MFSCIVKHIFMVFHLLHIEACIVAVYSYSWHCTRVCLIVTADQSIPEAEGDPVTSYLSDLEQQGKHLSYCTVLTRKYKVLSMLMYVCMCWVPLGRTYAVAFFYLGHEFMYVP